MTIDVTARPDGFIGELQPGSRIAGYVIEERIGASGLAVTFRARDEIHGRRAAVTVIAPPIADDVEFRARFLRESQAVAAINSKHIIPIYDMGEAEGTVYIATRFTDSGDLAALVDRAGGFLAPARVAALVAQVAAALDAVHAAGLVHRDVRPQKILIDSAAELPEHAFLSYFALTARTGSSTGVTSAGQFVGDPEYCAPELIKAVSADGRADQYALGCVAFALLTGQSPFHRDETAATLDAQIHDPVPSLCGIRPELPPAIDRVIARALAKSPAARYARCGEFAAALQAVIALPGQTTASAPAGLREGDGQARTITARDANAGTTRSPLTTQRGIQPERKTSAGRMAVIGALMALTLTAAAALYAARSVVPSPHAVTSAPSRNAQGPAATSPNAVTSAVPSPHAVTPAATSPNALTSAAPAHSGLTPAAISHGTSPASISRTASTSGSPSTASQPSSPSVGTSTPGTVTLTPVPGQVTGVTATPGDGSVALTWQAPPGSPTGYEVEVSPAPVGQNAIQLLVAATSDTITGLTAGTAYTFTVLASNVAGNGRWSPGIIAVPFGKPVTMPAPSAEALPIGATGAGSQSSAIVTTIRVTVNLGPSPDDGSPITGFTLNEYKASSSSGPWTEVASQPASAHTSGMVVGAGVALFTVSNDGSWYKFTATATNAAGESAQSPLSSPAVQVATVSATSSPTATS